MASIFNRRRRAGESLLSAHTILTLYFPAVVLSLGYGIATPAVPVFAKSFGTGFGVASLVIIVHNLGSVLSTIPTGLLLDRLGRKPILLLGPVCMAAASFLIAIAGSFPELLFYRFVSGWAQEMWKQARITMIADLGRERERGRQVTGLVGTEAAGRLLGPAVGGLLAGLSIRTPFVVHGILGLVAILPSFYLLREALPVRKKEPGEQKRPEFEPNPPWSMLRDFRLLTLFVAQLFAALSRGTLWGGTMLLYVAYAYHSGPELLGVLSTAAGIAGIPITFSSGYLMDRFGRRITMVPGFTLVGVGLTLMALGAYWQWSLGAFIAAFLWMAVAQSLTSGSMQVLGADLAPAKARGRFFGIWRLIGEVGHILSPALFALLAERLSYAAAFSFLALCAFLTAALVGVQLREAVARDSRDH
ncbi:MAG TPA: MFS transporter [Candidatus Acidoferrales bacterium]|nr:MFS transporter [Candidatus Acidoferrales bacterium]